MKHSFALVVLVLSVVCMSVGAFAQSASRSTREVQQALLEKGFNPGVVDGVWGKKSSNALKAFQQQNSLSATGKIDDKTISALFPRYPGLEENNAASRRETAESNASTSTTEVESEIAASEPDAVVDPIRLEPPQEQKVAASELGGAARKTVRVETSDPAIEPPEGSRTGAADPDERSSRQYVLIDVLLSAFVLAVLAILARRRKSKTRNRTIDTPLEPAPLQVRATVVSSPAAKTPLPSPSEIPLEPAREPTLAAHDEKVREWVNANVIGQKPGRLGPDNDNLSFIEEKKVAPTPLPGSSLSAHDAAVKEWVTANAARAREIEEDRPRGIFGLRKPAPHTQQSGKSQTSWIAGGTEVSVGGVVISKGLIYVGGYLGKHGRAHETENCLIDPKLKVAQWGDRDGRTMGYWPSYSTITPEARRSYLDWLASDRSDPETYIGYVFLYFYGLERRLFLDPDAPDASEVAEEVHRLLEIYGGNHSFHRYAMELLTAVELKRGEPSPQFISRLEPNGYEVPTALKIAIGVRVRDDRIIEPELMLRFATTHPETRTRTPAKRAPDLVRQLFAMKMQEEFPSGYKYKAARAKPLQKRYKACSGSFEIDIDILGGNIPDVTHHAQPIGTARRIFDFCSDALDDYSRALGRIPGLVPDLAAVSKLPRSLRSRQANLLEGEPLKMLTTIAENGVVTTVAAIAGAAGLEVGSQPSKAKLRELSQLLAAFDLGVTFDPAYAVKTLSSSDPATLFAIDGEALSEPTENFRSSQLAVMLGMMIGHADGEFHDDERASLRARIERQASLSAAERSRLKAEMLLGERNPERLDEWLKRLKDVPSDSRSTIADELISVASADGSLHAEEVKKLELVFKKLGIDRGALYDRLHAGSGGGATTAAPMSVSEERPAGMGAPIDFSRLQSIRKETSVTANVLADIFADDEPDTSDPIVIEIDPPRAVGDTYDGLERRYASLLDELRSSTSWSAADFEHLVRDAGLMPGAAREAINDWSLDIYDEILIEGDDPVEVNIHLLPHPETPTSADMIEGTAA